MIQTPKSADELEEVAAERPCDEGHDEAAEEEREQDAEEHAARHRDGDAEREGSVGGFVAVERGGGGEDQQRRGVVEQALALQHRDHPARHADAAEDRRRGGGVRRCDDGAERQRGVERQADERDAEAGDGSRAQHDGEDREREERLPEFARRDGGEVEGGVDQRRGDEEGERRPGVQIDLRRAGDEREPDAGRGQHRRIGDRQPARHLQQQDRDGKEQEQALEEAQGIGLTDRGLRVAGGEGYARTRPRSKGGSDLVRRRDAGLPGAVGGREVPWRAGLAGEAEARAHRSRQDGAGVGRAGRAWL